MKKKSSIRIIIALIVGFGLTYFLLTRRRGGNDGTTDISRRVYNGFQDDAIGILRTQLELGKGNYVRSQVQATKQTTTLGTLQKAKELLATDIVTLLESSDDRTKTLFGFINEMQRTTDQLLTHEQELQIKIIEADAKRAECNQQKTVADQQFSQGLRENNDGIIQQSIDQSQKRGACETEQRIQYNAYTILKKRLAERRELLSDKKVLIENNSDLILQNFKLFEDKTLMIEQLIQIRNKLEDIQRRARVVQ